MPTQLTIAGVTGAPSDASNEFVDYFEHDASLQTHIILPSALARALSQDGKDNSAGIDLLRPSLSKSAKHNLWQTR
jgi:hypothetical protein